MSQFRRSLMGISGELVPPNNEIWYDAPEQVTLYTTSGVQSHIFANGRGVLTFANDVSNVNVWFYNINSITKIYLPKSILSFNNAAFQNCSELEQDLYLPNTITIGHGAFGATKIKKVVAPNVTSLVYDYNLRNGTFYNCKELEEVSMPNLVFIYTARDRSISMSAFGNCTSLRTMGSLLKCETIGMCAFENCINLTDDFNLPVCITIEASAFQKSGIHSINAPLVTTLSADWRGGHVFNQCLNLEEINMPGLVMIDKGRDTYDYNGCFYGCSSLKNINSMPNIETIGPGAFSGCPIEGDLDFPSLIDLCPTAFKGAKITSFKAPVLATITGGQWQNTGGAFTNCTELVKVELPSLVSISNKLFDGCSKLHYIVLPTTVTNLTNGALSGAAFYALRFKNDTPPTISNNSFGDYPIFVPNDLVSIYQTATNWTVYASRIKSYENMLNSSEWVSQTSYVKYDTIQKEGKYYWCKVANTDILFDETHWQEFNPNEL